MKLKVIYVICLSLFSVITTDAQDQPENIIFILSDDHRYDYIDFHPDSPEFLKTPAMDRMAKEGAHLANAFVTTSLCSPSRASILTGQYSFRHGAVDNANPIKKGTPFFPQQLQEKGYETGFFGKWHIGGANADPKPGFSRWVSFRGQGSYFNPTLNIDGERKNIKGYVTDILTDYAVKWIEKGRDKDKPFFLYLSHKAVHSEFNPAPRHKGNYADVNISIPQSMENIEENYADKPDWVREQRYSWHGVDYMYQHNDENTQNLRELITQYSETLMGVDESIGRVLDYLERKGLANNTLVVYMGDNGFMMGEHGLIDKRNAYEESMRVPMLAWAPGYIGPGTTIEENVLNIDIASTFLDLAGAEMPKDHTVDGRSFLLLLANQSVDDLRSTFVYQYFWEHAFPHTPTTYAIRSDHYKYIYYHGVWDKNELYNLETDPNEMHNLIDIPSQQDRVRKMRNALFDKLKAYGATDVRFRRPYGWQADDKLIHNK